MLPSSDLKVLAEPGWEAQAQLLARQLGGACLSPPVAGGVALAVGPDGLSLRTLGKGAPGPVRVDFVTGTLAHRRRFGGGRNQDIARAVGLNRNADLGVADLTAGLGRDAFVLASLGATVTMVERHPVVAALLEDGLQRAQSCATDPELVEVLSRMALIQADSMEWLQSCGSSRRPDVIYLDPMFPPRRKSAKVKKEMAAFHDLVGRDDDAAGLLVLALDRVRYRVVVKRPVGAPPLADLAPGASIDGKNTRFDIYPRQRIVTPDKSA